MLASCTQARCIPGKMHTRKLGQNPLGSPRTRLAGPIAINGLVPQGVHRARLKVALTLNCLEKLERQLPLARDVVAAWQRQRRLPGVLDEVMEMFHARAPPKAEPQMLKAALASFRARVRRVAGKRMVKALQAVATLSRAHAPLLGCHRRAAAGALLEALERCLSLQVREARKLNPVSAFELAPVLVFRTHTCACACAYVCTLLYGRMLVRTDPSERAAGNVDKSADFSLQPFCRCVCIPETEHPKTVPVPISQSEQMPHAHAFTPQPFVMPPANPTQGSKTPPTLSAVQPGSTGGRPPVSMAAWRPSGASDR